MHIYICIYTSCTHLSIYLISQSNLISAVYLSVNKYGQNYIIQNKQYGNYTQIHRFIRTGILDYLLEGFPWPAWPFKHTESNLFTHTLRLNIRMELVFYNVLYYLRGIAVSPSLHIFKCRCRINTLINIQRLLL